MADDILEWLVEHIFGWVALIILAACGVALVALVICGVDSYRHDQAVHGFQGYVAEKNHYQPYTSTTLMPMGKVLMPMTVQHPERWNLTLRNSEGARESCDVTEKQWEGLNLGDPTSCD